jgi:hypothetical protein
VRLVRPVQPGDCQFTDGTTRPIYRDDDGRQYVLDDEGEPVYGTWLHPDEYQEPVALELQAPETVGRRRGSQNATPAR